MNHGVTVIQCNVCTLGVTTGQFAPQPNYGFEITKMELYTDPGNANQNERIKSRYIIHKCDMNELKLGGDTEWWKDMPKEVQIPETIESC